MALHFFHLRRHVPQQGYGAQLSPYQAYLALCEKIDDEDTLDKGENLRKVEYLT